MATQALDAQRIPKDIGTACVDLTQFQPTALMPADNDVMLVKTPDCTASATDTTPYAIVFKTGAEVTIPPRWRGGAISAIALPPRQP
jgi:hypothetical protein